MASLKYESTITLGSIITAVSMFGAAAAVYASVVSKDVQHDERIAYNSAEIARVEDTATEVAKELKAELKEVNRNLQLLNQNMARLTDPPKAHNARPNTR